MPPQYACGSTAIPGAAASAVAAAVPQDSPAARGAYLARIGNCALCHTVPGALAYSGGRAIETPFGAVLSSNITSDPTYGIGNWTPDAFWGALHRGESRDGHALYPAFPYTSYTHMRRSDADDLLAYLKTVPPSIQPRRHHKLRWPYSSPLALRAWRALFFKPDETPPAQDPAHAEWQRGQYLVYGVGHCMECHGERNALGALTGKVFSTGAVLPARQWFAPSLNDSAGASVAAWSEAEIAAFLQTGRNQTAQAKGPMAEVVLHGTQYLSDADAHAMAVFLKALPQLRTGAAGGQTSTDAAAGPRGARLYADHCAACHADNGLGRAGVYPALAGNRMVVQTPPNNLINSVLAGGFGAPTRAHPQPFGMPPFLLQLGDADLAALLSYLRSAWGNQAGSISEFDINSFRRAQSP